jgi:DNA gyrase subunit A
LVKKTPLEAYSRPKKGGIIAIKLREDDELVDVVVVKPNDQLLMSTAAGKAIRFAETDARSMGRNTSGVKGIRLRKGDAVVGMVVADPEATLLTVCEQGYGKRTWFGPGETLAPIEEVAGEDVDGVIDTADQADPPEPDSPELEAESSEDLSSSNKYRTQRRGGGGLIDIKTSKRNGPVVAIVRVTDEDELLLMTSRGKIQRIAAKEISIIGRNTQGVRVMSLDEGDKLTAIVPVPVEDNIDEEVEAVSRMAPQTELPPEAPETEASTDDAASDEEE